MNRVLSIRLVVLFLLYPMALMASANCDPPQDLDEFEGWITAINTDRCLIAEISLYPGLDTGQGGSTLVDATNGYHPVYRKFFEILEGDAFNGPIKNSINEEKDKLAIGKPGSEYHPLLITLSQPVPVGEKIFGAIKIGGHTVGDYSEYEKLCVEGTNQGECDAWIKTVRLMAAVDYLSADFRQLYNENVLTKFDRELTRYINLWDDYYEQRKPQMPWEMAVNQVANRDIRTAKYFATPPDGDWVVMHPSLVYSSISAADDGDEKDFALAIELIGYNWWKNDKLSGFSLVGVTSDRKGIEDQGYGLVLHFGSRYSLGWTRHDDDDGWYVSIDLLSTAIDKKKEVQQWADEFKESRDAWLK